MYRHQNKSIGLKNLVLTSLLTAACLSVSPQVLAKSWVEAEKSALNITADVVKDGIVTMKSDTVFSEVRVADTSIADIVVLTDHSFQLMGKDQGRTSVMVYDKEKRLVDVIEVNVSYDVQSLKKSLFETFPKEKIEVRKLAGKIYLSGNVSTNRVAEQAEKIAQAYGGQDVSSGLTIRDSHQVMLEVRFVEATRSAIKELGVGLLTQQAGQFTYASGIASLLDGASAAPTLLGGVPAATAFLSGSIGPTAIDVRIDAMEEKGIIRTLAEPNLVSMSGETASFLAGGEFPIPVTAQNGEIAITYRQFGVSLAFTPTVLDDGVINLKVNPEVSQLDPTNSVRVGGVDVPALSIRRAKTTIELRNGQSFAIAGLLQNSQSDQNRQVPWLGDVPVLGTLFRSTRYKKNETELVIIVTPKLVQPVSDISELASPLDGHMTPSDMELFLGGRVEGGSAAYQAAPSGKPAKTSATGGLSASYGHVIQ